MPAIVGKQVGPIGYGLMGIPIRSIASHAHTNHH